MKSFGKRYSTLNTRISTRGESVFRQLPLMARRFFLGAVLVTIFAASVNLLVKSVIGKITFSMPEINIPHISIMSTAKFQTIGGEGSIVMSDGSVKLKQANAPAADISTLPILSGISINDSRPEYRAVLKQALSIQSKYLEKISEVNLSDPKDIVMISTYGSKILFGDSITEDKLDNYIIALNKMRELGRSFKVMDLRFTDRVVLK